MTLINGGAVIAVLGFISALASKDCERIAQIVLIAKSLLWFSGGVAMAAAAGGFAFYELCGDEWRWAPKKDVESSLC
jgi:hypothetical protein